MIKEYKQTFVKEMEKVVEKLLNGYHMPLQGIVDKIFYINSIIFCGPSSTYIETESTDMCGTTTTLAPSCVFNGGEALLITNISTTTTTTTMAPPVYSCGYSGGLALILTV